MKTYEWAVIGGGASGIAISEILTREGHSVVLIEKKHITVSIEIIKEPNPTTINKGENNKKIYIY